MPYIKQEERPNIDECVLQLMAHIDSPGQFNYAVSQLAWVYLQMKGIKYQNLNEVMGVLECTKHEFYRRIGGKLEDIKIQENGDAFIGIENIGTNK